MKFACTLINEATPGGESNAAIRSKQTGRRRSGLIARVTPARAMSREAAQGSLLVAICCWFVDGVDGCASTASTLRFVGSVRRWLPLACWQQSAPAVEIQAERADQAHCSLITTAG